MNQTTIYLTDLEVKDEVYEPYDTDGDGLVDEDYSVKWCNQTNNFYYEECDDTLFDDSTDDGSIEDGTSDQDGN
eukprot:CAMPEP_0176348090 /NCGR_PEP_ID=MMETSP0126-20121128/7589_1 /TAXON_ID=141414 ORGANISM="Strombidinopsis acuminatum, Strain SPMC142" /NCGR_SAMPLE_ID=MMETSP0126 /ASSEMBLY_ACC=CAM_ASM_000229 /LENGTH=73 /DNA_ID=CAMNT_0017696677 /DNA_START=1431 /DNA_END=1652 /DNA_ORIENTATION=-